MAITISGSSDNISASSGSITTPNTLNAGGAVNLTAVPFFENVQTIDSNFTVVGTYNAMSAGPIQIGVGITVTINSGGTWSIL